MHDVLGLESLNGTNTHYFHLYYKLCFILVLQTLVQCSPQRLCALPPSLHVLLPSQAVTQSCKLSHR